MNAIRNERDASFCYDYILVGGGLQSGLIALAIHHLQPESSVLLIERDGNIAGNHTWSFHESDIPQSARVWTGDLVKYRWDNYEVRLDGYRRHVNIPYASVPSDHFASVVKQLFGANVKRAEECIGIASLTERESAEPNLLGSHVVFEDRVRTSSATLMLDPVKHVSKGSLHSEVSTNSWQLLLDTEVCDIGEDSVVTSQGHRFESRCVIDCRGPAATQKKYRDCGYQKFYGFEVVLKQPWPNPNPVMMDSITDQSDGFRFIYSLPFESNRVLIEDTCFSDSPELNRQQCLDEVSSYLLRFGISDFEIEREESGVLPMPVSGELLPSAATPLAGGYAGGWFHAASGYSFPLAVAFAQAVASVKSTEAPEAISHLAAEHYQQARFSRFLNRLMFRLVASRFRVRILKRFYRVLGDAAVSRFYSHCYTKADLLRIVVGIPPTIVGLQPLRFLGSYFRGDNS